MPPHPQYNVTKLLENEHVRITKVEIFQDGTVPRHKHKYGYAVVPTVNGRIRKTTFDRDRVMKREEIDLLVDHPYWIDPLGGDIETEVLNIGSGVVVFTKLEQL